MLAYLTGNRRIALLLYCLSVLFGSAAMAPAQSLGNVTINYIEAVTADDKLSNRISAYVTVSDQNDTSIPGLGIEAFSIVEDGQPVTVDSVSKATDAMAVILAIDTSGSMQARDSSGRTSMDAAKSAAAEFINRLGSEDRVALYAFNNEPALRLDFTTDHRLAMTEVANLNARPNAATCLYDTAYDAIKKAAEIPRGRRAIILLTDGRDEKGKQACSRHTANDVIDAATTKTVRVPIYTIGAGSRVDERALGRMASYTGGRYLQVASMSELGDFFRRLADQLKNQYTIRYHTRITSGEHSLVLKVRYNQTTLHDENRFWSPPLPVIKPPEVVFQQSEFNGPVSGIVELTLDVVPDNTIQKVRYYVDALLKKEVTAAPFQTFQLDTSDLPGGMHIVRAEVIDSYGRSASAELTLTVKRAQPAPAPPTAADGMNTALIAAGVAVLLMIAFLVGWSLRKRVKPEPADAVQPVPSFPAAARWDAYDDETVFMPDEADTPKVDTQATLTVIESENLKPGEVFHFSGTTRIGRTDKNDINLPDKTVSRKHAEIFFENNIYCIRDLGSQNGLKVNEKRVGSGMALLSNGARIRFSPQTVLEFRWRTGAIQAAFVDQDDSTVRNE